MHRNHVRAHVPPQLPRLGTYASEILSSRLVDGWITLIPFSSGPGGKKKFSDWLSILQLRQWLPLHDVSLGGCLNG
jgi:hypothetical protein